MWNWKLWNLFAREMQMYSRKLWSFECQLTFEWYCIIKTAAWTQDYDLPDRGLVRVFCTTLYLLRVPRHSERECSFILNACCCEMDEFLSIPRRKIGRKTLRAGLRTDKLNWSTYGIHYMFDVGNQMQPTLVTTVTAAASPLLPFSLVIDVTVHHRSNFVFRNEKRSAMNCSYKWKFSSLAF